MCSRSLESDHEKVAVILAQGDRFFATILSVVRPACSTCQRYMAYGELNVKCYYYTPIPSFRMHLAASVCLQDSSTTKYHLV